MANSYLPASDSGLNDWALNFANVTNNMDPLIIGLTVAEVAAYTSLQQDYGYKYTAAVDPATRGPATILAKNDAKKLLVAESRKLAMAATNHPATTDAQRQSLGLTIRDNDPTPVPPPSTAPLIDILSVKSRRFELRLRDSVTSAKRKPTGVQGATLFSYVGEEAPASLSDWKFEASTTKTDIEIDIPVTVPPGSKVWYTAFWFNRKSESGPATNPVYGWTNNGGVSLEDAA